ncbi:MAG TPA: YidB family protein [Reyranella sp.]|nr:YidB family protein [Reyranella sp.]
MGLMDVLAGMSNSPGGGSSGGHRGMSPLVMAALGLLAYKAVKGMGTQQQQPSAQPSATPPPSGSLGDILGSLGLGSGAATGSGLGGILSSGLGDLVRQFQAAGHGDTANSWVASGENKPIAPKDLENVLTPEQIDFLMQKTGMTRTELLSGLSQKLPQVVDGLTPQGRIPAPHEIEQV